MITTPNKPMSTNDTSFGKWPWCHKCNKPVDHMEKSHTVDGLSVVFDVGCHGEVESTQITLRDIMRLGITSFDNIEYRWAFGPVAGALLPASINPIIGVGIDEK